MRFIILALVLLLPMCAQADWEVQLPPFPPELRLDPDATMEVIEFQGAQAVAILPEQLATLRGRTEWARNQWLLELQFRVDVRKRIESTHTKVRLAIEKGYDGRISLLREHIGDLEVKAVRDEETIDELRNPPWYKSRGFVYGLGFFSAGVAIGIGGLLAM